MIMNNPHKPARKRCGKSRSVFRQKVRLNVYATTPKRTLYVTSKYGNLLFASFTIAAHELVYATS